MNKMSEEVATKPEVADKPVEAGPELTEAEVATKPVEVGLELTKLDVVDKPVEAGSELTKADFETLLQEGINCFAIGKLSEACEKLADATSLSVKLFGDFAPETYAPHFHYGKVLLEAAISEKAANESKLHDESNVSEQADQQEEHKESDETAEKDAEMKDESGVTEVDMDQTLDQTLNKEGEDEEVDDAQHIFEVFDYARVVCEKNNDKSPLWLERQKETFVCLSKTALCVDDGALAIEDLNRTLKFIQDHFPDDFRDSSFIHLELARIYRKTNDFLAANSHINKSIAALEQLKAKLPKEVSSADIDLMLEELVDEQKLTKVREREAKKSVLPSKTADDKPFNVLEVRRKKKQPTTTKRAAGDSIGELGDFKKSRVAVA